MYEMHVRAFSAHPSSGVRHPGTYLGVIEKLDYLQELGVNALELLPVQEFNELEYYVRWSVGFLWVGGVMERIIIANPSPLISPPRRRRILARSRRGTTFGATRPLASTPPWTAMLPPATPGPSSSARVFV